ncbi:peptidase M23 [Paramagnetospirillum marisnigri]|uniref:Peptidase M23 n=1 Tax=Paramagnetospirillum marisnigri TaxID=1285242 RepID=A0A178M5L5_9PROT|nr:M23 family metallopeptidase [Paramagnetospirillum marisnigri]OAN44041.1 peptidase M23 [Paramagnetospirillum marisnigri]
MRLGPHHLVRFLTMLCGVGLVAACQPSWESKVPVGHGGPMQVQRPATVTVYAGDTVYSIARRYSLPVRDLIEANHLQPPYALTPGTMLRLPGGGSDYVVQRGDTLSVLARRFKVDFNTFAATNNKRPPYVLQVGERLTIPGAKGTAAPSQAAMAPPVSGRPASGITIASPNAAPGSSPPLPAQPGGTAEGRQTVAPPAAMPPPPPRGASSFLWPVKGEVLAEFGPLAGRGQHNDGINIAAAKGTPVKAVENGTVAYVGNELKGFGNLLLVKHADGWISAYAHNEKHMVKRGDHVRRGQVIATVGASGNVTTPQLHFELRRGTEAVNPAEYLLDSSAQLHTSDLIADNPY